MSRGRGLPFWFRERTERKMRLSVVVEADVSMVPNFDPLLSVAGKDFHGNRGLLLRARVLDSRFILSSP